jgi:hypothetical protein
MAFPNMTPEGGLALPSAKSGNKIGERQGKSGKEMLHLHAMAGRMGMSATACPGGIPSGTADRSGKRTVLFPV